MSDGSVLALGAAALLATASFSRRAGSRSKPKLAYQIDGSFDAWDLAERLGWVDPDPGEDEERAKVLGFTSEDPRFAAFVDETTDDAFIYLNKRGIFPFYASDGFFPTIAGRAKVWSVIDQDWETFSLDQVTDDYGVVMAFVEKAS